MLDGPVTFRPLTRADFGPVLDGRDATEVELSCADGQLFGLLQRYTFADNPQYVAELAPVYPVPEGALSIDYLIGEASMRGRGAGAAMIAAFVAEGWVRYPEARDVVAPVAAGNVASWRALERAGFTRVAEGPLTPDNPIDPPDHVIYRIGRTG